MIKTLFNDAEYSGACTHLWDGTNQSGQQVNLGYYRVVVIDTCIYWDIETGGPVNVVVKEAWVHHSPASGIAPWGLTGYQSGPNEITLEWEYPHYLEDGFTIYCDGCLCGALEPPYPPQIYTDSGLIPGRGYVYWVKSYPNRLFCPVPCESPPSNADTVFVGSKLLSPSVGNPLPVDQSFGESTPPSKQDTLADVAMIYSGAYPGCFHEVEVKLKNQVEICGFNFLIKFGPGSNPDLIDFHTERISTDSILIDSDWVHYPVRECSIDTSGSLISGFSAISCRGQVADTALWHCKYLWVRGWAPPDNCIEENSNYQTLFRFGVDVACISDTTTNRSVYWDLAFGRLYTPDYEEIGLRYHEGMMTLCWSVPGDANADSVVHLGDIVRLVDYLYRDGPPLCIPEAGDANGDCEIGLGDIVYLVAYLYRGGPPPLPGCWHGKK